MTIKRYIPINLVYEDEPQKDIVEKILINSGKNYEINYMHGRGYDYIKVRANNFNLAARQMPFCIVTDLDKNICPVNIINQWFNNPIHKNIIFRVAVHEIEAWIMADREDFSRYFKVRLNNVPEDVDNINDPKEFLINIIKSSNDRSIKQDVIPRKGSYSPIGPGYNLRLKDFITKHWDQEIAQQYSRSLYRAIASINNFTPVWRQ